MLYERQFAIYGYGLRLDGSLYDGQLGIQRVFLRCDGIQDGLQLGLLVGIHLVDGPHKLDYSLFVLQRPLVDGFHHLGEVVDDRHFHLILQLDAVLLTRTEEC